MTRNAQIYVSNAVGQTRKLTMYKPTFAGSTPTEEIGIYATNIVEDAAGPTIGDTPYTSWRNYMILLDPVMIDDDNGPLQQYRSSFAYTDYSYQGTDDYSADGSSAKERVPEFPITGTF